jgi:hypothetical protein
VIRVKAYALLSIVLVLFLGPLLLGFLRVEHIRDTYKFHKAREASQTEGSKGAAAALSAQSNKFTSWAVGLLAWVGGVAYATELRRIPHRSLGLLLLPPAAGLLLASVWAGVVFDRRFSYLALNEALGSDVPLNNLLLAQSNCLFISLLPIGVTTVLFFWHLLLQRRKNES